MTDASTTQGRSVLHELDVTPSGRGGCQVLNPVLYDRMVKRFGSVIVAKPGEPMYGGGLAHDGQRTRYTPLSSGEYYRINCPFCLKRNSVDTKHRLWINHRWGVGLDPSSPYYDPNDKFWWMAVCYNENCLSVPENRRELRTMLYGAIGRENHGEVVRILPASVDNATLGVVDYPGRCQRVDQLRMEHTAYQYLLSRGFDPLTVGSLFDVSFCYESMEFPVASGKIIIPIYMDGKMVSWQARPPYDIDWKAAGQPKYYNCPGTNKRLMLYGMDAALALPYCIMVEGVTSVWAVGAGAIATLGKSLSVQQSRIIASRWKVAILALDPDAVTAAQRAQQMLNNEGVRTVNVQIPEGLDPASIDKDYFWDLVYGATTREGIDLCQIR